MKRKIAAQKNSPKDELGTSRSGANNRRGTIIIHQRYIEELKEREKFDSEISSISEEVEALREAYSGNMSHVHIIEKQIADIKPEIIAIRKRQLDYYYKILFEGRDNRGQGLSWVIKTIWYLKGDVGPKDFPKSLDNDSIKFIITTSQLDIERTELMKKLKDETLKAHNIRQKSLEENGVMLYNLRK